MKLWGNFPLSEEKSFHWRCGPLNIWVKRSADELWVAHKHIEADSAETVPPDPPDPPADVPENPVPDLEWSRWTLKESITAITVMPIFPEMPILVRPESPFRVTPGIRSRIYVRLPIWIRISIKKSVILELPTVVLSKTWFGTFAEGELCYWISSAARKNIEPDPTRPFLAICTARISNQSESELSVEKICLRVKHYSLFNVRSQLWTNEIRISYKGPESSSEIDILMKAPQEAGAAKPFVPPRVEVKRSLSARTFAPLKDLPGIGYLTR